MPLTVAKGIFRKNQNLLACKPKMMKNYYFSEAFFQSLISAHQIVQIKWLNKMLIQVLLPKFDVWLDFITKPLLNKIALHIFDARQDKFSKPAHLGSLLVNSA